MLSKYAMFSLPIGIVSLCHSVVANAIAPLLRWCWFDYLALISPPSAFEITLHSSTGANSGGALFRCFMPLPSLPATAGAQ